MKNTLAIVSILLLSVLLDLAFAHGAEVEKHSMQVDGLTRNWQEYVPDNLPASAPLLLVLHGGLGNADYTQRYLMNEVADREGFRVVYPEGTSIGRGGPLTRRRLVWNAGDCCGKAARDEVDDVHFIDSLVGHLIRQGGVDASRVYVTGMSNGAMMSYRLMCELPGRFAAAAPVAGTLTVSGCAGGNAVALLHIHGEEDTNVPVAGGEGSGLAGVSFRSLDETIALVTAGRDCEEPVASSGEADSQVLEYHCDKGAPVVVQRVPGLDHAWPGGELGRRQSPVPFSASEAVWAFVSQFQN